MASTCRGRREKCPEIGYDTPPSHSMKHAEKIPVVASGTLLPDCRTLRLLRSLSKPSCCKEQLYVSIPVVPGAVGLRMVTWPRPANRGPSPARAC